jgi:hypothetical protein
MPEDWAPKIAFDQGREALLKLNRTIPTPEWLKKLLIDSGFVDVEVSHQHSPE